MKHKNTGFSILTEQDLYYDGIDHYYDERLVSPCMLAGTEDCTQYILKATSKETMINKLAEPAS